MLDPLPRNCLCICVRLLALWSQNILDMVISHGFHKHTALQKVCSSSHSETLSSLLDTYICKNGIALFADMCSFYLMHPVFFWLMLLFILYFVLIVFFVIPTFRFLCGQPTKYLKSSQMLSDSFTKRSTLLEHT